MKSEIHPDVRAAVRDYGDNLVVLTRAAYGRAVVATLLLGNCFTLAVLSLLMDVSGQDAVHRYITRTWSPWWVSVPAASVVLLLGSWYLHCVRFRLPQEGRR